MNTPAIVWLSSLVKYDQFVENEQHTKKMDDPNNFFAIGDSLEVLETSGKLYKFHAVIGSGCSKRAFLIQEVKQSTASGETGAVEANALILPNTDNLGFGSWETIVKNEVLCSQVCSKIKLLNCDNKKVIVQGLISRPLSAYLTPSFPALADKGLFVIDNKHQDLSSWKCGENSFFVSESKPLLNKVEKWDAIVLPLIKDLGKAFSRFNQLNDDTLHICIKKLDVESEGISYLAKLFLFDFQDCETKEVIQCSSEEEYNQQKVNRQKRYTELCQEYDENPDQEKFNSQKKQMRDPIELVFTAEYGLDTKGEWPASISNEIKMGSNYFPAQKKFALSLADRHFKVFLWKSLKNFELKTV